MRRRVLALALALVLALGLVPMGVLAADETLPGSGTADDPYLIADAADLVAFRDKVNKNESTGDNKLCAKLTDDIVLSGAWTPFNPTSDYVSDAYAGTFDGDGHTISGLNIDSTKSNQGLFGLINGATIKNLNVSGSVISSNSYVGGIVGKVQAGTIQNCSFSGEVKSTKNSSAYAGGIVGGTQNLATISGCFNAGDITGYAGGIVGYGKADIQNCYNVGMIKGTTRAGGIIGQFNGSAATNKATNCYNAGELSLSDSSGQMGAISGFNGNIYNCYWTTPGEARGGTQGTTDKISKKVDSISSVIEALGEAFVIDKDGNVVLAWQDGTTQPSQDPTLTISGTGVLYQTNSGPQPTATLTAEFKNAEPSLVSWSIESGADVIALTSPTTADETNSQMIVSIKTPGKAVVKAEAGELSATFNVTVYPCITALELKDVPAAGKPYQVTVYTLGRVVYDETNGPELTGFTWELYADTSSTTPTQTLTGNKSTVDVPTNTEGQYLTVKLYYNGTYMTPNSIGGYRKLIVDQATAAVQNDRAALTLDTADIKAAGKLALPARGENGSAITWTSSNSAIIANDGTVVIPETGSKPQVTLTATLTKDGKSETKTFALTVWTKEDLAAYEADKLQRLKDDVAKLGTYYKMYPTFGTDTNVIDMLKSALNDGTIDVSIKDVAEVYGGAAIANDGKITYYYKDPNETASVHFASYRVTFTLTRDGVTVEKEIPVIVYWDRTQVEKVLNDEILAKLDNDLAKGEDGNYVLPKTIDGKRWALISWTSSDDKALSISTEGQQTADTLFDPYVGVVRPGMEEKTVTLTAKITFQYTNDVTGSEAPIALYKTFEVTIQPVSEEKAAEIQKDLQAKLDAGFAKAGLTDDVTGATLTADENGVYTVTNDIQLPTTRDFGVDGKVQPVTITTSDETGTLVVPDGNNAALVTVYRPAPGENAQPVTTEFTVTLYDKDTSVSASKTFTVKVLPLTQEEIDRELALMSKVKAAYFDGIKNANTDEENIRTDLHAFQEVYEKDGQLVWVYDSKSLTGSGIVPTAMKGWEELETWRLFHSNNPAVISHENLLVTRQKDPKEVKITSSLSSETLGRYGALYASDKDTYAAYKSCAGLYAQEVSVKLLVRGTANAANTTAVQSKISADFALTWLDGETAFTESVTDQEPLTVYEVFKASMGKHGYTYNSGSYVSWVKNAEGETLSQMDAGPNSGWMYKVNGQIPNVSMQDYGLKDGDKIVFFYTKDYTKETYPDGSHFGGGSTTTLPTEPTTTCPFTDLTGHWSKDEVERAWTQGLVTGMTETTFVPDAGLTRAMAVTMLYRMAGSPAATAATAFTDVPAGTWYAQAVAWAAETGVVKGMTETTFAPDEAVTRAQLATMLYRYAQTKGEGYTGAWMFLLDVPDRAAIADWAYEAVCWLNTNDVLKGRDDGRIDPQGGATRAEAAALYLRLADKLA